jgi:hypothetical protein
LRRKVVYSVATQLSDPQGVRDNIAEDFAALAHLIERAIESLPSHELIDGVEALRRAKDAAEYGAHLATGNLP